MDRGGFDLQAAAGFECVDGYLEATAAACLVPGACVGPDTAGVTCVRLGRAWSTRAGASTGTAAGACVGSGASTGSDACTSSNTGTFTRAGDACIATH
jgi:hypothetical protein